MSSAALTPRRRTALIGLAGLPVLLTACAQTSDDGGGDGGGGGGGEGGGLAVGTTDKVTALDPAAAYDNGSFAVWTQVYGHLMNTEIGSEDGVPAPDLAETAEFTSPDVYTVTLKEGLTFSNGNTLTSEDVKHSFDRQLAIADPNGPSSLLANLESVDVVDERTVEFHLVEPDDQTFPYILCSPAGPIVDADVFPADAVLSDDEIVAADPFSGPYRLTSWSLNELAALEAFDGYQGIYGTPVSPSVSISYYSDQNNMKLDIQQGTIDLAYRSLSPTDIADLQGDDAVSVHEGPGGEIRYIVFNFATMPYGTDTDDADPAKSLAVRQAAADLLDRQAIASGVYNDTYTPLYSYIPEGLPGSGTQFQDLYGDGSGGPDADRARARLEDAGVEIPVALSLQYNPDHYGSSSGDEYALVKSQLEADGLFAVDLQSTEWVQYSKDRTADVYPSYQLGWFPDYPDADNYLAPFFILDNFLVNHYDSPEVQDLIAAQRGEADATAREDLFVQIQDLVAADVSTLPLLQGAQIAVSTADVEGVTLDSSFKLRLGPISA